MVHELPVLRGRRPFALGLVAALLALSPLVALAGEQEAQRLLGEAKALFQAGKYFQSARYAFAAGEEDAKVEPEASSWVTLGLVRAHLYQSASFFFIKTLQSADKSAIRRALTETHPLLVKVGPDLLRRYLIRHTAYEDYDGLNRSAYLYALAKDALLKGDEERSIGYVNGMATSSSLWPFALQLRGSAKAIQGQNESAIADYRSCADLAKGVVAQYGAEAEDLRARCQAGIARVHYQTDRFDDADRAYDQIEKDSFVWPEILFEQAWNSFAKREFNRSLGKLVSYKSPSLSFVFNTEVDVLRAQSFLALCLYADANEVINEFNGRYAKLGEQVKEFVEKNASNLPEFYRIGKDASSTRLHTTNELYRMLNRFVRAPYFKGLVATEKTLGQERQAISQFDSMQSGVTHLPGRGFPGFLGEVLEWRGKAVRLLGGAYVKNGLLDYHAALIADFEKMAFIKLEMLGRAKDKLLKRVNVSDRSRGAVSPSRRDDQYQWGFNGEFWTDELGDFVFGLESECQTGGAS